MKYNKTNPKKGRVCNLNGRGLSRSEMTTGDSFCQAVAASLVYGRRDQCGCDSLTLDHRSRICAWSQGRWNCCAPFSTCPIVEVVEYTLLPGICSLLVQRQNLKRALEMGVTPPHLRTSYNLFFLQGRCLWSWKRMVVGLRSLQVALKIAFVCVLMSNFGVDFARYFFQIYPLILSPHAYI